MEVIEGAEIVDLGLHLTEQKILVVSDFHLGYEEALSNRGIMIPRHQLKDTKERLQAIFDKLQTKKKKLKTIVVSGDLKHEFGSINRQEWLDIFEILDLMSKNCEEIVLLKGNHDPVLQPIANKKNLKVQNHLCVGDFAILHGDQIPVDPDVLEKSVFVMGHEHPAIKLTDEFVSEKVKCFLKGKWHNKTIIVIPSFNLVTEGTDVASETLLSPFLQGSLSDFEVWAIPEIDKPLYFGRLRNLA